MKHLLACMSLACLGFAGVALGADMATAKPLYLKYERSLQARKPCDAVVTQDRIYVLEQRHDLLAFDRKTFELVQRASIPSAVALTQDPSSGDLLVMGMTAKRGPWQTIYRVDLKTLTPTLLFELDDAYGFNDDDLGFVADGTGRLILNSRYAAHAITVVSLATGAVLARISAPGEKPADSPLHEKARAAFNSYRLRPGGDRVYALNVPTGSVSVFALPEMKLLSTFDLPRGEYWREPEMVSERAVAVVPTAFDLALMTDGSLFVLANVEGVGYVVQNGRVVRGLEWSPGTPPKISNGPYAALAALDEGRRVLLLSPRPPGRVDIFAVEGR